MAQRQNSYAVGDRTRFQRRRRMSAQHGVNDKHCWASFREASDSARGWSLMGSLLFSADQAIENIHAARARAERSSDPATRHMLRQQRKSLRNLVRRVRDMERGLPSALNGLRAQIDTDGATWTRKQLGAE